MDEDEYFCEEAIMKREPLLYHMYVGRFSDRNGMVKEPNTPKDLSKFLFQRIDKSEYETALQQAYESHLVRQGKGFFDG